MGVCKYQVAVQVFPWLPLADRRLGHYLAHPARQSDQHLLPWHQHLSGQGTFILFQFGVLSLLSPGSAQHRDRMFSFLIIR